MSTLVSPCSPTPHLYPNDDLIEVLSSVVVAPTHSDKKFPSPQGKKFSSGKKFIKLHSKSSANNKYEFKNLTNGGPQCPTDCTNRDTGIYACPDANGNCRFTLSRVTPNGTGVAMATNAPVVMATASPIIMTRNHGSYEPPIQTAEDIRYQGPGGYGNWKGEATPGRWVRKLGFGEKFMSGSADYGIMSTVYGLWFESRHTVTLRHVREASGIVAQKLPHLRLCVNKKDGHLWYREMENPIIDVQEHVTTDTVQAFEYFLNRKFDLEKGPMWFVRYIKVTENNDRTPSVDSEAKSKFVLLFGFHHNFTDGTSNVKFCDVFLKVLNDVMLERATDMKVEARFAEPFHDRLSVRMKQEDPVRSNMYLMYYFCKRFYKGIILFGRSVHNFTKHYNQQPAIEPETRIIPGELNEEITAKLMAKCKQEKVTLNSAFTAASNIALYKMILAKDPSIKRTDFSGIQTVNARRYWSEESRVDSIGCHITTLDINIPTDRHDLIHVWEYMRNIQATIKHELDVSKKGVRLMVIGERLKIVLIANSFLDWAGCIPINDNHFCITNMGDITKSFTGEGEAVQCTKVLRSVSAHFMNNLCQHTIHTFRGKLYHILDYYTQKMTKADAETYAKQVLDTLQEFIET